MRKRNLNEIHVDEHKGRLQLLVFEINSIWVFCTDILASDWKASHSFRFETEDLNSGFWKVKVPPGGDRAGGSKVAESVAAEAAKGSHHLARRIIRDMFLYWSEGGITLALGVLGVTIQFSVFSVDTRTRAMRTTQPSPTTNTCGVLLIDSVAQWKWERESGQIWLEKVFEPPQFGDVVHN